MSKSRTKNVKRMKKMTAGIRKHKRLYKEYRKRSNSARDTVSNILFVLCVIAAIAVASYAVFK